MGYISRRLCLRLRCLRRMTLLSSAQRLPSLRIQRRRLRRPPPLPIPRLQVVHHFSTRHWPLRQPLKDTGTVRPRPSRPPCPHRPPPCPRFARKQPLSSLPHYLCNPAPNTHTRTRTRTRDTAPEEHRSHIHMTSRTLQSLAHSTLTLSLPPFPHGPRLRRSVGGGGGSTAAAATAARTPSTSTPMPTLRRLGTSSSSVRLRMDGYRPNAALLPVISTLNLNLNLNLKPKTRPTACFAPSFACLLLSVSASPRHSPSSIAAAAVVLPPSPLSPPPPPAQTSPSSSAPSPAKRAYQPSAPQRSCTRRSWHVRIGR